MAKVFINSAFFYLLFIFNCFAANAQSSRFALHWAPMSVIDYNPRIRIGAEYRIHRNFSVTADMGFGKNLGLIRESRDYKLIEIRPELKYYFTENVPVVDAYISVESFYIHLTESKRDGYFYADIPAYVTFYDEAKLTKYKYGFHLKTGLKFIIEKHFSIDLFAGIGKARRNIIYSDLVNGETVESDMWEEWFAGDKYPGISSFMHVSLGMRLGYIF